MTNCDRSEYGNTFLYIVDNLHIYKSKRETAGKFICVSITWLGCLSVLFNNNGIQPLSATFLIFSVALFMEFTQKLSSANVLFDKVYTSIILFCATVLFGNSIFQWFCNRTGISIGALWWISFIPVGILILDTFTIIFIESPKNRPGNPENSLLSQRSSSRE